MYTDEDGSFGFTEESGVDESSTGCSASNGHNSGAEGQGAHRANGAALGSASEVAHPPSLPSQAVKRGHSQTLDISMDHAAEPSSDGGAHGAQQMLPSRGGDAAATGHERSPKRATNGCRQTGISSKQAKGKRAGQAVLTPMLVPEAPAFGAEFSHPPSGAPATAEAHHPGPYFGRLIFVGLQCVVHAR